MAEELNTNPDFTEPVEGAFPVLRGAVLSVVVTAAQTVLGVQVAVLGGAWACAMNWAME